MLSLTDQQYDNLFRLAHHYQTQGAFKKYVDKKGGGGGGSLESPLWSRDKGQIAIQLDIMYRISLNNVPP